MNGIAFGIFMFLVLRQFALPMTVNERYFLLVEACLSTILSLFLLQEGECMFAFLTALAAVYRGYVFRLLAAGERSHG